MIVIMKPHLYPTHHSASGNQRRAPAHRSRPQQHPHDLLFRHNRAGRRQIVRENAFQDILDPVNLHVGGCSQRVEQIVEIPFHFFVVRVVHFGITVDYRSAKVPGDVLDRPDRSFEEEVVDFAKEEVSWVGYDGDCACGEHAADVRESLVVDDVLRCL